MPQVPRYTDPTVQTIAPSSPQMQGLSPDAFGAGLGQGLTNASGAMFGIAHDERLKVDRASLLNATSDGSTIVNTLLDEAKQVKGQAAINQPQKTLEEFDKNISDVRATLNSPSVLSSFDEFAKQQRTQLESGVLTHSRDESNKWFAESDSNAINGQLATIRNFVGQPQVVADSIKNIRAIAMTGLSASNSHLDPDSEEARIKGANAESAAHIAVAQAMMDSQQPIAAKKYFDEQVALNKITGTDAATFYKHIAPVAEAQEVSISANKYYTPGQIIDLPKTYADVNKDYADNPVKANHIIAQVLNNQAQYNGMVVTTVNNAKNSIAKFVNDAADAGEPTPTWDQIALAKKDEVGQIGIYDAATLKSLQDVFTKNVNDTTANNLLNAIDTKLFDLHSSGKYPNAKNAESLIPELGVLKTLDSGKALLSLDHIEQVYQGNVHWKQSLATLAAQRQAAEQQVKQQQNFVNELKKGGYLSTGSAVLRATGTISAEQASMLDALKKQNDELAKGHPVSWSQDQLKATVKDLLGIAGTLSPNNARTTDNAVADLGMYIFREEKANGAPLNPTQVQVAAQKWAKQPNLVESLVTASPKEVSTLDAFKLDPSRLLIRNPDYAGLYQAVQRKNNGAAPTLTQMSEAWTQFNKRKK